jgi:hypothetical protein
MVAEYEIKSCQTLVGMVKVFLQVAALFVHIITPSLLSLYMAAIWAKLICF